MNTPQYLFGPNMKLSEQGQQSMYSAGPTDPNAPPPTGRIDAFQRAHGIWHEGMGRMDLDQLGQPLPGTAPPPGTNLPAGPMQFLPDPPPPAPAPRRRRVGERVLDSADAGAVLVCARLVD